MNTSKIVLGIVVYVMLCGQSCFTAAAGDDSNSTKKTPLPKAAVVQPPQQVIVQQQYVRDPSFDKRTSALELNQRASEQQIANLRQDLTTVDTDLRTLFDQNSKQDVKDAQILQKLDRIEKLLGTINGRLKKLEERVDRQDVKIRKLKNANSPAPETKESTDPNQPAAGSEPNQP